MEKVESKRDNHVWREDGCEVRARLNLSQCECDEMCKEQDTCARSVVQCDSSGEVRCGIVLSVVISICVIELSVPVLLFHIVVLILLVVIL